MKLNTLLIERDTRVAYFSNTVMQQLVNEFIQECFPEMTTLVEIQSQSDVNWLHNEYAKAWADKLKPIPEDAQILGFVDELAHKHLRIYVLGSIRDERELMEVIGHELIHCFIYDQHNYNMETVLRLGHKDEFVDLGDRLKQYHGTKLILSDQNTYL